MFLHTTQAIHHRNRAIYVYSLVFWEPPPPKKRLTGRLQPVERQIRGCSRSVWFPLVSRQHSVTCRMMGICVCVYSIVRVCTSSVCMRVCVDDIVWRVVWWVSFFGVYNIACVSFLSVSLSNSASTTQCDMSCEGYSFVSNIVCVCHRSVCARVNRRHGMKYRMMGLFFFF